MKIETGIIRTDERGIKERIVIEIHEAIYPYRHMTRKVWGKPINTKSAAYLEVKHKLGDDWETDLTDSWYMPGNFTYAQMEIISEALSR